MGFVRCPLGSPGDMPRRGRCPPHRQPASYFSVECAAVAVAVAVSWGGGDDERLGGFGKQTAHPPKAPPGGRHQGDKT